MKIEIFLVMGLFFYLGIFVFRDRMIKKEKLNNSLKFKKQFFEYRLNKLSKQIP